MSLKELLTLSHIVTAKLNTVPLSFHLYDLNLDKRRLWQEAERKGQVIEGLRGGIEADETETGRRKKEPRE